MTEVRRLLRAVLGSGAIIYKKRHEPGTLAYYSLCGPMSIRRDTYRPEGFRNGPTAVPLDLVAGIVERAAPALAYNVAHGCAQYDMRLREEALQTALRSAWRSG